ncbi:MAG: hypothetical protein ACR2G5_02555 [Pyrinomonadaceae bacterium]
MHTLIRVTSCEFVDCFAASIGKRRKGSFAKIEQDRRRLEMMSTDLQIDQMTLEEKLRAMEALSGTLSVDTTPSMWRNGIKRFFMSAKA